MQRYFDRTTRQLVYYKDSATSEFWDSHWSNMELSVAHAKPRNQLVESVTRQFIKNSGRILEGGCGPATTVAVLEREGHVAVGVDFALGTLRHVHGVAARLRLVAGDVFHLPFADSVFDACWSLGVIEHFYGGYAGILSEAQRVVRPGGYLFLTFPWMSPLRRLCSRLGLYLDQPARFDPDLDGFYQFALHSKTVHTALNDAGFQVVQWTGLDAFKGIKDELPGCSLLSAVYTSSSTPARIARYLCNKFLGEIAGHAQLVVAQRRFAD